MHIAENQQNIKFIYLIYNIFLLMGFEVWWGAGFSNKIADEKIKPESEGLA